MERNTCLRLGRRSALAPDETGRAGRAAAALAGWLAIACLGFPPAGARAQVPLDDGRDGMTCHFYAAAAHLRWAQPGGDWVDAAGRARGDEPLARTQVSVARDVQEIRIDATAAARAWNDGARPAGGLFLRALGKAGVLDIASREHPEPARRPSLSLTWDDGRQERLEPVADTFTACPTHKSLGADVRVRVSNGYNTLLVFPFEPRAGRKVTRAELRLTSDKQYAPATTIGLFLPDPPIGKSRVEHGLAARYPGDAGIEKDPDVLYANRFEDAGWRSGWSDFDPKTEPVPVSADGPNRFAPIDGKALKVTVAAGTRTGLNMHFRLARHGGEPDELYFRYYLRLGESWDPTVTGGKLPGLSGTYGKAGWGGRGASGTDGWSARGAFFRWNPKDAAFAGRRGIGSYVYHAGGSSKYGLPFGWNLGPTGMLEKNRWYSVEQYVRMNRPGQSDGVLRAWIDGQLALDQDDLRFRDVPDLKIESVWMNVYHGGIEDAPTDLTLFIDNLVVAKRYIGPMAGRR